MPFSVHVHQPVLDYLNSRDYLTVADRERILQGIADELGAGADAFLTRNPHPFLPDRYGYDYTLMTEALEIRAFVFACSAEGHIYGVTEVLYGEERPSEEN